MEGAPGEPSLMRHVTMITVETVTFALASGTHFRVDCIEISP